MRQFLPLAALLVVITGSPADEPIKAPVPKTPDPPSISGSYVLLAANSIEPAGPAGPGGWGGRGGIGGPGGQPVRIATVVRPQSTATITGSEITMEGRAAFMAPMVMEYTLDTTKSPMTIDVEKLDLRGKKMPKQLGIVEVRGNRLTIALAKEGGTRPKTTEEAEDVTIYYFQKVPPPPHVEYRILALTAGREAEAEKELNKLVKEGYELVSTTSPIAPDAKSSVTTIHFVLKRTVKQP